MINDESRDRDTGTSDTSDDTNLRSTMPDTLSPTSSKDVERIVPLYKRLGAEIIGTFALVFAAVGSDISDKLGGHELGRFAVTAVPGLVIMAMIYGLDKISGAYFNPAVSIGFTISKHLKVRDLPLYILVQIIGSIIASLVVIIAIGQAGYSGLTLPGKVSGGGWYQAFILEIVLTFLLMIVSISMKEDKDPGYKNFGGIAIGGIIILADIIGMQISGASMNPARSFGPALVAGNLSYNWIYWVAPIIGSLIAIYSFKVIKSSPFYKHDMEIDKPSKE
jgi:MIP family channel proteins